jgi:hypothetical protein
LREKTIIRIGKTMPTKFKLLVSLSLLIGGMEPMAFGSPMTRDSLLQQIRALELPLNMQTLSRRLLTESESGSWTSAGRSECLDFTSTPLRPEIRNALAENLYDVSPLASLENPCGYFALHHLNYDFDMAPGRLLSIKQIQPQLAKAQFTQFLIRDNYISGLEIAIVKNTNKTIDFKTFAMLPDGRLAIQHLTGDMNSPAWDFEIQGNGLQYQSKGQNGNSEIVLTFAVSESEKIILKEIYTPSVKSCLIQDSTDGKIVFSDLDLKSPCGVTSEKVLTY